MESQKINKDLEIIKTAFRNHYFPYSEVGLFEFGIMKKEIIQSPIYDNYSYEWPVQRRLDCIVIDTFRQIIKGFEFKTSRGDFLNEIRTEKYKKYLEYCHLFYFACPEGLIQKEEIPKNIGLIWAFDCNRPYIQHEKRARKLHDIEKEKFDRIILLFLQRIKYRKNDFF